MTQVHRQVEGAQRDREPGIPQRVVGVAPRRVGPGKGQDRGAEQDERTAGLGVQEVAQGRQAVGGTGLALELALGCERHVATHRSLHA